jgi:hypothetical protein
MTSKQQAAKPQRPPDDRTFFVDEAGDPVFFGKRGKVLVGTDGCSRYFMLGMAQIEDHADAFKKLEDLRAALLADPYFKGVPSMQEATEKTALCFHAKNDPPEVRREVFKLLQTLKVKVCVVVRDKQPILSSIKGFGIRFRIDENDLYDSLVKELFHNQLHAADSNKIVFARRGKTDRIEALSAAIISAKAIFRKHAGISDDKPCEVSAAYPSECVGLQAIDYHLWAYQRMKEKGEARFYDLVAHQFAVAPEIEADGEPMTPEMRRELCGIPLQRRQKERPKEEGPLAS